MINLKIKNYQPEIDCLRAIAVLLVILFHFEISFIQGGFIGVDIFFVISGYLITNLLLKDLADKKFSLFDFYIRRLRRIVPALYFTILVTLFLSYFILSPNHFDRISKSSLTAASAYSNFFFWAESGYFNFDKYFKPLLHTWSLSVELQFYLIWPIIILFINQLFKNKIKLIILSIIIFSLFFSTIYSDRTSGYFYFTFFRFFEFGIGSFIYLIKNKFKIINNDLVFLSGFIIIILSALGFSEKSIFPGINALVPCIGTSLILISSGNLVFFKKIFVNKILIDFGKISYSLYLIHWPLIVLYKYIKIEPIQYFDKLFLIIITILISLFSYRFIELPFRMKTGNYYIIEKKFFLIITLSSLVLIFIISNYLLSKNKFSKLAPEKQIVLNNLQKDQSLLGNFEKDAILRIKKNNYFNSSLKPTKVLIWGDSHAGDLYNSLRLNNGFSKLDIEFLSYDYFYCFKENSIYENLIRYIKNNLLSLSNCRDKIENFHLGYEILSRAEVILVSSRWEKKFDVLKLKKFIDNYSNAKIIIIGRKSRFFHIPTLFIKSKNNLNYLAFLNRDLIVDIINKEMKEKSKSIGLYFYDLDSLICDERKCYVINENNLLFTDEDHWSYQGSIYFGNKIKNDKLLEIILN